MYCRVCGSENDIAFRFRSRLSLCDYCHKTTPAKVTREKFDEVYWKGQASTVPENIKKEFYSDYKMSTCDLKKYIKDTTMLDGMF